MTSKERSTYQRGVINRYYENLDSIMLQRLGELVTELYLCESKKKSDRLWERVEKAMIKLKIKERLIEHIMEKRNVEVLAKNLQDWQGMSKKGK